MHSSQIFVTVDAVVVRNGDQASELLLIKRKNDPFRGSWALPGGFVDDNEDLQDAAHRELLEETGIVVSESIQLKAFGRPGRDPRQRTVSVAFLAFVDHTAVATAGDDAVETGWFSVTKLPELAFDHDEIINFALLKMRER